jgi:hypothetical protein
MIVKMKRPADDSAGPWVVYDEEELLDFIDPTPELQAMMPGLSGFFEVEPTANGWNVKKVAPTPAWT